MELWEQYELQEHPPIPCEFRVGDQVFFINEAGIHFEMEVVGFAEDASFQGRFVHTRKPGTDGRGSAWWFPHKPEDVVPVGATTRLMLEAPRGAIFIWGGTDLSYPKQLAQRLRREDLELVFPSWLDSASWRGRKLSGVVLDHLVDLKISQLENLQRIRERIALMETCNG